MHAVAPALTLPPPRQRDYYSTQNMERGIKLSQKGKNNGMNTQCYYYYDWSKWAAIYSTFHFPGPDP